RLRQPVEPHDFSRERLERALLSLPQVRARLEDPVAHVAAERRKRVEQLSGQRAAAGAELDDVARAKRRELGIERQCDGTAERTRELRCRDEIAGRPDLLAAG